MTHTEQPDPVQMRRAYKFLLRPTPRQVGALNAALAIHCEVYNAALEHRREAWNRARVSVSWVDQCLELTEVRKIRPDVAAVSSQALQQTLRRLNRSFDAFFRRMQAGEKPGYPRFRSVRRFDSMTFPQLPPDGGMHDGRVNIPRIGLIRVHRHRPIPDRARMKQLHVKREGRRWYLLVQCEGVDGEPMPATDAAVGIDMGVTHFLTTSDGEHVPNPRYFAASAGRLAEAQRSLELKKRGSTRRKRAVERVADHHRKVQRQRVDHAHKTALALVRDHDVIVHETLQIGNMTRSAQGTLEHPGVNVSAKRSLACSVLDAGWGRFFDVLRDKAESAGRVVLAVNPRNSSRTCSVCRSCAKANRRDEAFRCQACGHEAHADVNAAINILRSGLDRQPAKAA